MPPRRRFGHGGEGPGHFAAGPDQGVIGHRLQPFTGQKGSLEGNALLLQPAKVIQGAFGIESHTFLIHPWPTTQAQVAGKIFRAVLKTRRLLYRRAATTAEVELATGEGSAATPGRGHLQHCDTGASAGCLDCRAGTRYTEANH